ncbi:MAG: rhodanese-like domain-containing protein [Actinomycetota bacterium]
MAHKEAPASDAAALVAAGAQLVDVREPDETAAASLPDSVFIPLGDLPERIAELDPARPVILLCRSGGRSGRAAEFLTASGFADVTNLTGGMMSLGLQE